MACRAGPKSGSQPPAVPLPRALREVRTPRALLLARRSRAAWADKIARTGHVGLGRRPLIAKSRMAATMQHYVDRIEQVPVIVLVCMMRYTKRRAGGGIPLPGVPHCVARRPGFNRAGSPRLHPRVEPGVAPLLARPTTSPCRRASRSACPPGTTARCGASRWPKWSTMHVLGRVTGVGRRPPGTRHTKWCVRRPVHVAVLGVPALCAMESLDGRWSSNRAPSWCQPLHRPCDTPRDRWRSASAGWE